MKNNGYTDQNTTNKINAREAFKEWVETHISLYTKILCYHIDAFDQLLDVDDLNDRIEFLTEEISSIENSNYDINKQRELMDEILP